MAVRVFITGDRKMNPHTAFHAVLEAVGKSLITHGPDVEFVTGDAQTGVEAAVRYLLTASGRTVAVLETPRVLMTKDGVTRYATDYTTRNASAAQAADLAVLIHGDPLGSRIALGLFEAFNASQVAVVTS